MYSRQILSYLFVILATVVGILSLLVSAKLVKELSLEEVYYMYILVLG